MNIRIVLDWLLTNGEDFRMIFNGCEYMNIGKNLYCDGQEIKLTDIA